MVRRRTWWGLTPWTITLWAIAGCGGHADCGALAAAYAASLPDAQRCEASAQDPCTAQRPLVVREGTSPATARITGLCWTAAAGYLDPARTSTLDRRLADYTAAGCAITYCPGPAPHPTLCTQGAGGAYTCGG